MNDHIKEILERVQQRPGWEAWRRYQVICQVWPQIIDPALEPHTRPLGVQRQRLTIAVSSPTLAQTLHFQRHTLLHRLNQQLIHRDQPSLTHLRFSAFHWHQRPPARPTPSGDRRPPNPVPPPASPHPPAQTPTEALQYWLAALERNSALLPSCPQCQSQTRPADLDRWGTCALCARKHWQQNFSQNRLQGQSPNG